MFIAKKNITKKNKISKSFVVIILLSLLISTITIPVSALSGSSFRKDLIIDDSKFYRTSSMSASSIQSFLNSKMPSCDTNGAKSKSYYYKSSTGRVNDSRDTWVTTSRATYGSRYNKWTGTSSKAPYICLKNYKASTANKAAVSGLCTAIQARTGRTAAQIIYEVSQACGIDSKVLLVMLEKEQGLISDDWPWKSQYRIAMGYGCPDDGSCSSTYYGFFNQVYNAARQLKNYKKNPGSFNYASGRTSFVAYQANAPSCGGTNITMSNAATAALYNYTPYQPNAAALNNLYGTGNSCSAYGNRNFWRMYNDWFGSTVTGCTQSSQRGESIYRLYNKDRGYRFYTGFKCEADTLDLKANWRLEGVAFNHNVSSEDNLKIYRLEKNGKRFFTISKRERDELDGRKHGWTYEGVAFYSIDRESNNPKTNVFRLYNAKTGVHFWTSSISESNKIKNTKGWRYEGTAFYVPTT